MHKKRVHFGSPIVSGERAGTPSSLPSPVDTLPPSSPQSPPPREAQYYLDHSQPDTQIHQSSSAQSYWQFSDNFEHQNPSIIRPHRPIVLSAQSRRVAPQANSRSEPTTSLSPTNSEPTTSLAKSDQLQPDPSKKAKGLASRFRRIAGSQSLDSISSYLQSPMKRLMKKGRKLSSDTVASSGLNFSRISQTSSLTIERERIIARVCLPLYKTSEISSEWKPNTDRFIFYKTPQLVGRTIPRSFSADDALCVWGQVLRPKIIVSQSYSSVIPRQRIKSGIFEYRGIDSDVFGPHDSAESENFLNGSLKIKNKKNEENNGPLKKYIENKIGLRNSTTKLTERNESFDGEGTCCYSSSSSTSYSDDERELNVESKSRALLTSFQHALSGSRSFPTSFSSSYSSRKTAFKKKSQKRNEENVGIGSAQAEKKLRAPCKKNLWGNAKRKKEIVVQWKRRITAGEDDEGTHDEKKNGNELKKTNGGNEKLNERISERKGNEKRAEILMEKGPDSERIKNYETIKMNDEKRSRDIGNQKEMDAIGDINRGKSIGMNNERLEVEEMDYIALPRPSEIMEDTVRDVESSRKKAEEACRDLSEIGEKYLLKKLANATDKAEILRTKRDVNAEEEENGNGIDKEKCFLPMGVVNSTTQSNQHQRIRHRKILITSDISQFTSSLAKSNASQSSSKKPVLLNLDFGSDLVSSASSLVSSSTSSSPLLCSALGEQTDKNSPTRSTIVARQAALSLYDWQQRSRRRTSNQPKVWNNCHLSSNNQDQHYHQHQVNSSSSTPKSLSPFRFSTPTKSKRNCENLRQVNKQKDFCKEQIRGRDQDQRNRDRVGNRNREASEELKQQRVNCKAKFSRFIFGNLRATKEERKGPQKQQQERSRSWLGVRTTKSNNQLNFFQSAEKEEGSGKSKSEHNRLEILRGKLRRAYGSEERPNEENIPSLLSISHSFTMSASNCNRIASNQQSDDEFNDDFVPHSYAEAKKFSEEDVSSNAEAHIRRISLKEFSGLNDSQSIDDVNFAASHSPGHAVNSPLASRLHNASASLLEKFSSRRRSSTGLGRLTAWTAAARDHCDNGASSGGSGGASVEKMRRASETPKSPNSLDAGHLLVQDSFDCAIESINQAIEDAIRDDINRRDSASDGELNSANGLGKNASNATKLDQKCDYDEIFQRLANLRTRVANALRALPNKSPGRASVAHAEKLVILAESRHLVTACKIMVRSASSSSVLNYNDMACLVHKVVESAERVTLSAEAILRKSSSLFQAQLFISKLDQMLVTLAETIENMQKLSLPAGNNLTVCQVDEAKQLIRTNTRLAATLTQLIHTVHRL